MRSLQEYQQKLSDQLPELNNVSKERILIFPIIGAVVIGRNEGVRLERCLMSLLKYVQHIVYVDSGSTDKSVEIAKSMDVNVVSLDLSIPFTAARARNSGVTKLLELTSNLQYIQFVDGDCEIQPEWLSQAEFFLSKNENYAVVCGRRRERYPESTIFNQLCDLEWNTPIGNARACGGDALIRLSAYMSVNGYSDSLIAGEEPEMCFRMRQLGWKIMRIDTEMTLHDAAMTRFSQWWKRNQRAGHAYAESYNLHGNSEEQFRKSECRSIVFWAAILPIIILVLGSWESLFWLLLIIYPLQIFRLVLRYLKVFKRFNLAFIYACSNVVGKWPQLMGMFEFIKNKYRGRRSQLMEYK